MSGEVIDFGFDDGKVVKQSGMEKFVQPKDAINRISVIAFKRFHDVLLAAKAQEKESPLDDKEIAELTAKIDKNLAEKLDKKVGDLTEVDRLDIQKPKFSVAYTHYGDDVGFIRCISEYSGSNMVTPALCCNKFGDADQTVVVPIMTYPTESKEDMSVDGDLLSQRKYTDFYIWKLSAKKFKKVEGTYKAAREDNQSVIDMKITIDGDAKFQKQLIEKSASAYWARDDTDPEIRKWVLEQGLRAKRYIPDQLGFLLSKEKLADRLGGGSNSSSESDERPQLQSSYSKLLE